MQAEKKILRTREREQNNPLPNGQVRVFRNPTEDKLNFDSPNFFDVIRWNEVPPEYISSPPYIKNFTVQEIKRNKVDNNVLKNSPNALNHSQHCEGKVKITSQAVENIIGKEKQEGNLVSGVKSREKYTSAKKTKKADFLR